MKVEVGQHVKIVCKYCEQKGCAWCHGTGLIDGNLHAITGYVSTTDKVRGLIAKITTKLKR